MRRSNQAKPAPKAVQLLSRVLLALLLALLLTRLISMAVLPLMDTTEARYGEIARKMVELNDWITPWHDEGVPFWAKPPLSFWLTALSFKLLGFSEFAGRLPHFLCSLAIASLVWHLARQRSARQAWLATGIMAGSLGFFVSSAAVMTDEALVLGITLALHSFWMALHAASPSKARLHGWCFFVAMALGILAKGPVAVVFTMGPLALWVLWEKQWARAWHGLPWVRGMCVTAALALPWFILAEIRTPGFWEYFLIGEHLSRFLTPGWTGDRYGSAHHFPMGTIWFFAILFWLPWSVLLPFAAFGKKTSRPPQDGDRAWRRYLLLWALSSLVFFTPARNIIWPYALPSTPPIALLLGAWLAARSEKAEAWVNTGLAAGLLISAAGLTPWFFPTKAISHATAKELVTASEHLHTPGQNLIYLVQRPFSAAFYSHGQAKLIANPALLASSIPPQGALVAVHIKQRTLVPSNVEVAGNLGQFGDFELLAVKPLPATTPSP